MTIDLYIKKMVNYLNLTLEISFSTLKALNMNFSQNEHNYSIHGHEIEKIGIISNICF